MFTERFSQWVIEDRFAGPRPGWDRVGAQMVDQRWLETLVFHQRHGTQCPALLEALAAWLRHVRSHERTVDDPMVATLAEIWTRAGANGIAAALFGPQGLFAKN